MASLKTKKTDDTKFLSEAEVATLVRQLAVGIKYM